MCVVALALDAHPKWRLVLAGNRDEFHARPSAPLARWEGTDSHIIAGRDLQSGGTWLGVSERGRLAVVTNIRTGLLPDPDKASRGALIADFLSGNATFDQQPTVDLDRYNPFSLFAVGRSGGWFAANRSSATIAGLDAGVHSLSNGLPTDIWPRKERLRDALNEWLTGDAAAPEDLLDWLADETPLSADDSHSPIFIRDEHYGTRCSTVVAVDRNGSGIFIERCFGPYGFEMGENQIAFSWPSPSPTGPGSPASSLVHID
jgi:uncharacterized protein with NRDE domain